MGSNIDIQWIGHRKDGSSRGAIYGWFVEIGKPCEPPPRWYRGEDEHPCAYIFRGRIGKKMHIEERFLTDAFLAEIESVKKNFKTVDAEKTTKNWGKAFDEELSMFVMLLKLKA
jgi:hypothetical protein